jgi:hypothetical protein
MRGMVILALLPLACAARADEIEPAVATSSAALVPPPTIAAPAPATSAAKVAPGAVPARGAAKAGPAKQPAGPKSTAHDQIELDRTQITGNSELPNVMYVVPWKRPDLGDFAGRPAKSLVDEALAPVDRDVFRRQNRYFSALQADAARPASPPAALPAAGNVPPAGDEK